MAARSRKCAFTLAEVLITLGIIGVVAAMTMPILMTQHRKQVVETRLAKFYSTINQAITRAEVDYGDKKEWDDVGTGYENDSEGNPDTSKPNNLKWFNKYLAPYIQYTDLKTYNDMVQVYFADGSMLLFRREVWIFYPDSKYWHETTVDSSSLTGRKSFTFYFAPSSTLSAKKYHYNKGVEPYAYIWDGTIEDLKNNARYGCQENASDGQAYCTKWIQLNGWKIPKDYPFKF